MRILDIFSTWNIHNSTNNIIGMWNRWKSIQGKFEIWETLRNQNLNFYTSQLLKVFVVIPFKHEAFYLDEP